jgi:hypothetical protein
MTSQTTGIAVTTLDARSAEDRVSAAALLLYEAECALHIARHSDIDAWVAAAYDRLHEAVLEHSSALASRLEHQARDAHQVKDRSTAPGALRCPHQSTRGRNLPAEGVSMPAMRGSLGLQAGAG